MHIPLKWLSNNHWMRNKLVDLYNGCIEIPQKLCTWEEECFIDINILFKSDIQILHWKETQRSVETQFSCSLCF